MSVLERIKTEIDMASYAATYGYATCDHDKSSRACIVLRRQDDDGKIGISRDTDGHWVCYDFRRGKGGSILDFVMREKHWDFGQAKNELAGMLDGGISFLSPTASFKNLQANVHDRRRVKGEYKSTWWIIRGQPYLKARGITDDAVKSRRFAGMVGTDRRHNACFPYFDRNGIAGIERRNRNFKGYTKGGRKGLWRSILRENDQMVAIFESPIDALSYACLHPTSIDHTRYFATGGQIGKNQWTLLDGLVEKACRLTMQIVLAFDNDRGGRRCIDDFLMRYSAILFELDLPTKTGLDWNDMLLKQHNLSPQ